RLAPNVRARPARAAGALAFAVAVLAGGRREAGAAPLPAPVRADTQLLDPGRSAGWTYTGFIDVGTPAHFPTRHVVNSAEVPLRVAAVTVEGSGDASLVSRISLVPLEAEGVRSADGIVVGGSSFPWVDGLVAIDPRRSHARARRQLRADGDLRGDGAQPVPDGPVDTHPPGQRRGASPGAAGRAGWSR